MISPYFGGINLSVFDKLSLFGISEFLYISYTSPYLEFWISLLQIKTFLLCLIILPIWKGKSPYLASRVFFVRHARKLQFSSDVAYLLQGSFYCDQCGEGYLGNATTGCYLADYCTSGAHDCSDMSSCVYIGPAQYRCEVGERQMDTPLNMIWMSPLYILGA